MSFKSIRVKCYERKPRRPCRIKLRETKNSSTTHCRFCNIFFLKRTSKAVKKTKYCSLKCENKHNVQQSMALSES